jgi:RimJ/RimL family protein N-acetyltransferase
MTTDPASSRLQTGLPIRTERLTLRPVRPSDLDAMHAIYSDLEATQFLPGGVRDYAGIRQRVTELIDHHDRHGISKWAVTLQQSGLLIGDCGLQFLPGRKTSSWAFTSHALSGATATPPKPRRPVWPGRYPTEPTAHSPSSTQTIIPRNAF